MPSKRDYDKSEPRVKQPKSKHITWHGARLDLARREACLGQRGAVLWFTGLSGSGKSTLARGIETALVSSGRLAYVLDGDNLRHGLNADLGFSPEDRVENIRRVGEVAALLADAGAVAIVALISPYRAGRDHARAVAPEGRFFELYLDVPLVECERRDPKGLYLKARAGEIQGFTGIDAPYEAPERAELTLDTSVMGVDDALARILSLLEKHEVIGADA